MFCKNCGSQVADGMAHCEKCGYEVHSEQSKSKVSEQKNVIRGLVVLCAVLIVIGVSLWCMTSRKITIDLNQYVTISIDGYDTVGDASYMFNHVAFIEDFADKIKMKQDDMASDVLPCEMLLTSCVSGALNQTSGLSNGDVVTYNWMCDDEAAEEIFQVELKYEPIEKVVDSLESLRMVDLFKDIEVNVLGIPPKAYVEIINHSTDPLVKDLVFEAVPRNRLKNGDTFVVQIKGGAQPKEYYAEHYEAVISEETKEYTVSGLDSYVQSIDEIPLDLLEEMKTYVETIWVKADVRRFPNTISIKECTYEGSIVLLDNGEGVMTDENQIHLVYKVVLQYKNRDSIEEYTYYMGAYFEEVLKLKDGTIVLDWDECWPSTDSVEDDMYHLFKWQEERSLSDYFWQSEGYDSLETAYKRIVLDQAGEYDAEVKLLNKQ